MAWVLRAAALALALLVAAPAAFGQSKEDLNRARSLYRQGLSLEAAGDWAGALAKFEEVARVKLTPQVRYHIARSKEHLGRLNEALGDYRLAEYEAQQARAEELAEITRARAELETKIPKLVIARGQGAERARLELDGVELGEARVGKEINVDPGPHRIVAKLPQGSFEENVTVAEGETKSVELVAPADLVATKERSPADAEADAHVTPATGEGKGSALPWIVGGVGVASLAASGVFFALRSAALNDLDDVCQDDVCPKRMQGTEDDGKTYTLLGNVTLGVGIAGVGVATVLLLTGGGSSETPAEQASPTRPKLDLAASRGFTGVRVVGAF